MQISPGGAAFFPHQVARSVRIAGAAAEWLHEGRMSCSVWPMLAALLLTPGQTWCWKRLPTLPGNPVIPA
jgi:hypothetical protein